MALFCSLSSSFSPAHPSVGSGRPRPSSPLYGSSDCDVDSDQMKTRYRRWRRTQYLSLICFLTTAETWAWTLGVLVSFPVNPITILIVNFVGGYAFINVLSYPHLPAGCFKKRVMSYLRLFHFLYLNLAENPKNWFENKKMGGSCQKIVFLVKICHS